MRYDLGRFRRPMRRSTEGQLASLIGLGDGSTLSLDFTAMSSLDSRFTFSRSTNPTPGASFIGSNGLVQYAGTNVPRFDYDPTTLAPRGLLIEGTSTNLVTQSEAFTVGVGNWTDTNITRDGTLRTSPDGTANALRITASAANATIIRSSAIGTSTARTFSIWLRRVTGTGNIDYTQNNGTNWNTQPITSSWVRYTFTHTANHQVGIRIVTNGDAIELWGAQLEDGSGASSYVFSGASQGQRAADSCSMTGTNFSSWFNNTAGTLLVSARTSTRYVDASGFDFPAVLTLDSANHIGPCQWNGVVYGVVRAGGSYRINYATLVSPGNNANYKAAIAYADSDFAAVANGGSIQAGSGTTVPSGLNRFALGASRSGVAGNFFGHISQIKFWPTRLPNATLQSITQ